MSLASEDVDRPPFEVTETGYVVWRNALSSQNLPLIHLLSLPQSRSWGEFEVQIRLHFIPESAEKAILFYHHLKLHPWAPTGTDPAPPTAPSESPITNYSPVHSWQYDEVIFFDPFQNFLNILTSHPPTPLPKEKRRPYPFHTANPASLEESRTAGVPEFSQQLEKEELERLDTAKRFVVAEQVKWRNKLIEKEKELARLKKELGE